MRNLPLSRRDLIARIENATLKIIEQICAGRPPRVSYPSGQSVTAESSSQRREDAVYPGCSTDSGLGDDATGMPDHPWSDERDTEEDEDAECPTIVDFAMKRSRDKFVLMTMVMAEAHHLLLTNTSKTRRSFYYELKSDATVHLVPDQRYVDRALNNVAGLLECAPWDLSEFPPSSVR